MERLGQSTPTSLSLHRKVRFNLPDPVKEFKIREHGTSYINGTLINGNNLVNKIINYAPVTIQKLPPVSCLKQVKQDITLIDKEQKDSLNYNNQLNNRNRTNYEERLEKLKTKHVVVITKVPTKGKKSNEKMLDSLTINDKFSRFRLFEDILARKRRNLRIYGKEIVRTPLSLPSLEKEKTLVPINKSNSVSGNLFSPEYNRNVVADLVQRWNRFRYKEQNKFRLASADMIANRNDMLESVSFQDRLKADVRRFGCVKMSIEREPPVTTLLHAAREADEQLLKIVLKKILIEGISKEDLNATDKSGRTAISYICSTNLTSFLDILLQIPGIDINKSDNEGNTPLHFAAQAGQADSLNMILTRCKNLQIDAKNCLGFTPLMKAALQGRTRCAKLLLFAGASPLATDSGRGLRAEEWARFCGRESCAEMLEKCTKVRMLEKSNSLRTTATATTATQSKLTLIRSKTNPCHEQISESFRSKFKKFLPFGFSMKDKSNRDSSKKDLVNYLSNSAFCASGPAVSADARSHILTTLVRPLEVPKLEVTPANNQQLIKKYESKMASSSRSTIRH